MAEREALRRNSIISTVSLFLQSGYAAILGFTANVFLTIYLTPEIFGIYITVLSIIALLNYFSDIGLAASLIQKQHITDDDVKTAFTVQQLIIVTLIGIGFILTSPIIKFYDLNEDGRFLYWMLLLSFLFSSLKTIPSVFLERKVKFNKIVFVQMVENTVFYIAVILLASLDYGLMSFAYGVILRSVIGLIVMYSVSFWMPRIGLSVMSLRDLLSYGVPFQSMSFLALFKDELVNLFLGKLIGFQALGYIGWAKRWAESTLRIIMDNVSRVVFPVFSRVQHDTSAQKKVIEKLIAYQSMIMIPASLGLMCIMPLVVDTLPQYDKWRPALPIFYIFVLSGLLSSYSTPFINFFNGIGKVKLSLGFMIFWTIATWILIVPLTWIFGMLGFPLTVLLLSLTCIVVVLKAQSIVAFKFRSIVMKYIISGMGMTMVVLLAAQIFGSGYIQIVGMVLLGAVTYVLLLRVLFNESPLVDMYNEYKRL